MNGENVTLDLPGTMVPVCFIAESTGQEAGWDARTRTVIINTIWTDDIFKEPGNDFEESGDNFIEPGDAV